MIKLLIVDDDPFIRIFMRNLIIETSEIDVIGEAEDGQEAVRMAEQLKPDVITMDLEMPHMDGLKATKVIAQKTNIPIIMVSAFTRKDTDATLEALELGAVDFISKSSSFLGMDIAHIETELKKKVFEWGRCTPDQLQQKRAANLKQLQKIRAELKNKPE
ncbi:response regulator [Magnetococcales bacterium HHB-1]